MAEELKQEEKKAEGKNIMSTIFKVVLGLAFLVLAVYLLIGSGWWRDTWFVEELGGAFKASSALSLSSAIKLLSGDVGKKMLAQTQAENFPVPEDWGTETKIVRFLENLVRLWSWSTKC